MARTRGNLSRKAVAEKLPRKVEAAKSGIRSRGPGNKYKSRPTPAWQKTITSFMMGEASTSKAKNIPEEGMDTDNDAPSDLNGSRDDSNGTAAGLPKHADSGSEPVGKQPANLCTFDCDVDLEEGELSESSDDSLESIEAAASTSVAIENVGPASEDPGSAKEPAEEFSSDDDD